MQEGYKNHEDMFTPEQQKLVIEKLKEPLEFFGYFKTTRHDHKYTKFERPPGFDDCDTVMGPKYKVHNKTVLK